MKTTTEDIIQILEWAINHLRTWYLPWANTYVSVALKYIKELEKKPKLIITNTPSQRAGKKLLKEWLNTNFNNLWKL